MKATAKLRQLLREPGIIVAPGAYDCLTAKLIERQGFPAVYMTGAGTALTRLGQPDLGLATLSEMVANAAAIAATVSIPLIADADTGYGGALNVYRTVREYERAGVAALHLEDQVFPKRCGHLDGKQVISCEDMVIKLQCCRGGTYRWGLCGDCAHRRTGGDWPRRHPTTLSCLCRGRRGYALRRGRAQPRRNRPRGP